MVVIKKLMKWLGIALILYIIWMLMLNTTVAYIVKWTLQYEGLEMQKNEWREFDLDKVAGETPASLFGGLQQGQSLIKYRLELMYPFDGKVGFYGGSDREQQEDLCFKKNRTMLECAEKNETAYLFRTIDDGNTFTRYTFGHGIVDKIHKIEDRYFINIHEADTWKDRTLRSDDFGESWVKIGDFCIEAMFDKNRFIYSITKVISISEREKSYFYTKDGGKTAQALDKKIVEYYNKAQKQYYQRNGFQVYQGDLVFLIDENIIQIDIDTFEEKKTVLDKPPHIKLNHLNVNEENNELYIYVEDINAKEKKYGKDVQSSIWYPLTNELVRFDKDIPYTLYLEVKGKYIGGLLRYRGLLTHIWTMDKGKTWKFELLPHYFWDTAFTGYGNNRIYMEAIVKRKKGIKDGSYLIMGKIK
jgi:hypothetical protein